MTISGEEIHEATKNSSNKIGTFDAFIHRVDELEHAYNKLKGVKNKPTFKDMYHHVSVFLKPFIEMSSEENMQWNHNKQVWEDIEPESDLVCDSYICIDNNHELEL